MDEVVHCVLVQDIKHLVQEQRAQPLRSFIVSMRGNVCNDESVVQIQSFFGYGSSSTQEPKGAGVC